MCVQWFKLSFMLIFCQQLYIQVQPKIYAENKEGKKLWNSSWYSTFIPKWKNSSERERKLSHRRYGGMWSGSQDHETVSSPVPLLHWPSAPSVTVSIILCHKMEVADSTCMSLDSPVRMKGPSTQQRMACRGASVVHIQLSWVHRPTSRLWHLRVTILRCLLRVCTGVSKVCNHVCHPVENMCLSIHECRKGLDVSLGLSDSCELTFFVTMSNNLNDYPWSLSDLPRSDWDLTEPGLVGWEFGKWISVASITSKYKCSSKQQWYFI